MEDLIPTILSKYDDSTNKYKKIINISNKKYTESTEDDFDFKQDGKIIFDDKEQFFIPCFFLGSYNINENVWIWNWAHPLAKNQCKLGYSLISYGLNYDRNKLERPEYSFIRSILVNSRFKVKQDFNFDILMGLILHITNLQLIIPIEYTIGDLNIIYYFGIKDVNEKQYI